MPKTFLRTLLLLLLALSKINAEEWPTIPPEVWAMKNDPLKLEQGAILLEDFVRLGKVRTEHRLRIRILSELGRSAAYIDLGQGSISEVQARTSFPNGTSQEINAQKDFLVQESKFGTQEVKRKILIPPGMTGDCVVDLRWNDWPMDRASFFRYGRGSYLFFSPSIRYSIARGFPVERSVIEISKQFALSTAWVGLRNLSLKKEEAGDYRRYIIEHIPAMREIPYCVASARENPTLLGWGLWNDTGWDPAKGMDSFWNIWSEKIGSGHVKSIVKGRRYIDFLVESRRDLPEEPLARARSLMSFMASKVQFLDNLHADESNPERDGWFQARRNDYDLDTILKIGGGHAPGLWNLAYQLLVDNDLQPMILHACDRDTTAFHYELPNSSQFNRALFAIAQKDETYIWVDPGRRDFPVGLLDPRYQATECMLVDPLTGKGKRFRTPPQPAGVNRMLWDFTLRLEDEADQFTFKALFGGMPAYEELRLMTNQKKVEQIESVKRRFEQNKGFTMGEIEVEVSPQSVVTWRGKGAREAEVGRRRVVHLFPGMGSPLWIPGSWDETRTEPLILPYCREHTAVSRFKVPNGWRLLEQPSQTMTNAVGSVGWSVEEVPGIDGTEVTVTMKVIASRMVTPASEYRIFKEFLAWVEQAYQRTVTLERGA